MRLSRPSVARVAALALIALGGAWLAGAQDSMVGTWIGSTQVPDQGTDQVTLTISKTDSAFAATVADSLGLIAGTAEIKDLTIANGELAGSFALGSGDT